MSAQSTISFNCSACGKCCNSPPAMTLAELFQHAATFLGCLTIGKVKRLHAGARIAAGDGFHVLDAPDAQALSALRTALLYDADPLGRSEYVFSIGIQGLDYPSAQRCPALSDEGLCRIHDQGKPAMCSVVPLDPLLPDRLQHSVLRSRLASASFIGAQCLQEGEQPGFAPLVRFDRVVDQAYEHDLSRRRDDLARERANWGNGVFALLKKELFDGRGDARQIPVDGYLSLPLAPVLAIVASADEASRLRCAAFIDSQLALIDAMIAAAMARKVSTDRATTAQLRTYAQAYLRQRELLSREI